MLATTQSVELEPIRRYKDQHKAYLAVMSFIESNEMIFTLSGYAGTGKTFLMAIVAAQLLNDGWNVCLTAPTNKAVKQLRKFSNNLNSQIPTLTVAKLLGIKPVIKTLPDGTEYEDFEPEYGEECKVKHYDCVIVDESSMIHEKYFELLKTEMQKSEQSLFNTRQKKLIFVGDPAQLPPVGEKKSVVFSQIGASLKNIIRYDGNIIKLATHVRTAKKPDVFKFVDNDQILERCYEDWLHAGIAAFCSEEVKGNSDFIRFLSWTNKRVDLINQKVRDAIYGVGSEEFLVGERIIASGVCQQNENIILNNCEEATIVNIQFSTTQLKHPDAPKWLDFKFFWLTCRTDWGQVVRLRVLTREDKIRFAQYLKMYAQAIKAKKGGQWRVFWELKKSFHNINYCYAITIHKSQGSTFNNVFVDIPDICRNFDDAERNKLLYVAVTRASDCVWLLS